MSKFSRWWYEYPVLSIPVFFIFVAWAMYAGAWLVWLMCQLPWPKF